MKTVRTSLFETNSSSIHALVISKNNNINIVPIESHSDDNYGIDPKYLHDPNIKFDYLITALKYEIQRNKKMTDQGVDMSKSYINYSDNINEDPEKQLEELEKILVENHVPFKIFNKFGDGYIDCSNSVVCDIIPELLKDPNKLMRYLFNDDSYLRTGNDGDNYITDLICGVVDDDPRHIINGEKFDYLIAAI